LREGLSQSIVKQWGYYRHRKEKIFSDGEIDIDIFRRLNYKAAFHNAVMTFFKEEVLHHAGDVYIS